MTRIITLLSLLGASLWGSLPPATALYELIEGNRRFSHDQPLHINRSQERRRETAGKQEPFATIVGCSDSRVPSEIIFDQGIGDLFIVRVAGNVVGPLELASIEYGSFYLGSSLILVLGHESCGAVRAVLDGTTANIEPVAELIQPIADQTKDQPGNRLENTIKANALYTAKSLKKNPVLKKLIEQQKLQIVAGYYNFHTGQVEILSP